MSSRKEKFGHFALGIFLGLLIAVSVFWWQRNIHDISWISFTRIQEYFAGIFDRSDEHLSSTRTNLHTKTTERTKTGHIRTAADSIAEEAMADSLTRLDSIAEYEAWNNGDLEYYIDYLVTQDSQLIAGDYRNGYGKNDSLFNKDSLPGQIDNPHQPNDMVRVMRDVMILSKIFTIKGVPDSVKTLGGRLDSLLTDERTGPRIRYNQVRVEFWKSPINYKGYKYAERKLILFGIQDIENISFEVIDQRLYLRYRNQYLALERTDDFRPLVLTSKPAMKGKTPKP